MANSSVLIIEDDDTIRKGLQTLLTNNGFLVQCTANGTEGLQAVSEKLDIVILDIMLPDISGFKICEMIREKSNVPILFLTAKDQDTDKMMGFMAGGDDYITKPFSYIELVGRVNALIRRRNIYDRKESSNTDATNLWLILNNIRINKVYNRVIIDDKEISLTEIEYNLLLQFIEHPEKIFSVKDLYETVWDEPYYYSSSNSVMVYIRRLRQKIETNPQKPQIILTVWGKGYRLGQIN